MAESDSELNDDRDTEPWIRIQKTTFTNWVNDKLRDQGTEITDCRSDFRNGVNLCRLMVALKDGKRIGRIIEKKNLNHYEASVNLALALSVMQRDGVRLVNIGSEDIASGNEKLILGMIWLLIRHYQIGSQSKLPAKQMMHHWIRAVLHPHVEINNFNTDWNDGVALHGIIEYCAPGTFPDWRQSAHVSRVENCEEALRKANELFDIPIVVKPESFASPNLDDLSCLTYLSYFMSTGAPGYRATLSWVQATIAPTICDNFKTDWNDGRVLTALVGALGRPIIDGSETDKDDVTCEKAMVKSRELGVPQIITARYMTQKDVDHIAIMAYAEWHRACAPETPPLPTPLAVPIVTEPELQAEPELAPEPETERETDTDEETTEDSDPTGDESDDVDDETDDDDDDDESEGDSSSSDAEVENEPASAVVIPPIVLVPPTPEALAPEPPVSEPPAPEPPAPDIKVKIYDNWRIYAPLTIQVEAAEEDVEISVHARSPNGTEHALHVSQTDAHDFQVALTPDEKGAWVIDIHQKDQPVPGSPFTLNVYDPSYAEIIRHYLGPIPVNEPYTFTVKTKEARSDEVRVHVQHENEVVDTTLATPAEGTRKVTFTPEHTGMYDVSVYLGGDEITGSPFMLESEEVREVSARGDGLRAGSEGLEASFEVDTRQYPDKKLIIDITGPNDQAVDAKVDNDSPIIKVSYVPPERGIYKLEVIYNNVPVPGSPFRAEITFGMVKVYEMPSEVKLNREYSFVVDAKEVGRGRIEIDSDLPVLRYDKVSEKCYRVSFVPKKAGLHDLVVKYNDRVVGEPTYNIMVTDD